MPAPNHICLLRFMKALVFCRRPFGPFTNLRRGKGQPARSSSTRKWASVSNPSSTNSHNSRTTATSGRLVPHEQPNIPGVSLHNEESAARPGWPPSAIYIWAPPVSWVTCASTVSMVAGIEISTWNNHLLTRSASCVSPQGKVLRKTHV